MTPALGEGAPRDRRWVKACLVNDIDEEDVIRFDYEDKTFAVYRSPDDTFHATDGICTHECAHLSDGLVLGDLIECPKHNGRFNYKTGEAKRIPACVDLQTYPVRIEDGAVFIELS